MGAAGSKMVGIEGVAVDGRAGPLPSSPVTSSAASCIQLNFWWRDEPDDEELEGAAVCRVQAEARAASLSSSGVVMERTMSCGANLSVTVKKWTATRAMQDVSD